MTDSTSARYTSPALSRALREAGVSQTGERFWYYDHQVSTDPFLSQHAIPSGPDRVRALRLDEILEELEALGVRPWLSPASGTPHLGNCEWVQGDHWSAWYPDGNLNWCAEPIVEAAGLLLLAVRKEKERKKEKP